MTPRPMIVLLLLLVVSLAAGRPTDADIQLPVIPRAPRSDWLNVRDLGAVGDGKHDDTAAIQAAYDRIGRPGQPRVAYFPPGTYRLTGTVTIVGDVSGIAIIGHGRDTVLVWDGEPGGSMYWSNGVHRCRYEGLTYEGRGIAGIGSEHRSLTRYETHIIYEFCAFRNLEYGIAVSKNERKQASAEIHYRHCIWRNNETGILFNRFNDYDHWFDGCVWIDNGTGILSNRGHWHVRNSHFIRSRQVDVRQSSPCHPASIRWSTSHGSHRFFETGRGRHTYPFTLQDNWVEGWTAEDGAVQFGWRGPDLLFDNSFVDPPNADPPVRLVNGRSEEPWTEQLLVHSNNLAPDSDAVIDPGRFSRLTEIPAGKRDRLLTTGDEWFLPATVRPEGKVFDARADFGAVGDGRADDTAAIRATIAATREAGGNAIAYLPFGTYRITETIELTGSDYTLESTGFGSILTWDGPPAGPMLAVCHPQLLTVRHLQLNAPDGVVRIRQTGGEGASRVHYDNLHLASVYEATPGVELVDLPPDATVTMGLIAGCVRAADSGQATVLGSVHLGRLLVEGARLPKTGFLGMVFHNDATRDVALTVLDNQDLVVGDFYNETNERFLLAAGGERDEPGRLTIGASKVSVTVPAELITIDNYAGRIWVSSASIQDQTYKDQPLTINHTGSRPVDLMVAASAWVFTDPVFKTGEGFRYTQIENALWALKEARSFDNVIPAGGLERAAGALDDFRQLGAVNRRLLYPWTVE